MRFCRNLIRIPPRWLASLFNLLCPVALWLQLTQGFNSFQLHWFCTDNPDNVPDCLKLLFFWYSTVLKAFGAIASSSVAFQWQLEQFKITKSPKLWKWKWTPFIVQPLSLRNTRRSYSELMNNWILQLSSPLSPPPLLLPCLDCLLTMA